MRAAIILLIWTACGPAVAAINPIPIGVNCSMSYDEIWGNSFECQVNGTSIYGSYNEIETIDLSCVRSDDAISLWSVDIKSQPIFLRNMHFENVEVSKCLPAPGYSYADIFTAMNINVSIERFYLRFDKNLVFSTQHFKGLTVRSLNLDLDMHEDVNFDINILKTLDKLREVEVSSIILPPWPKWSRLEIIKLWGGEPEKPLQIWGECSNLQQLTITKWYVDKLPNGWLANCSQLQTLKLMKIERLRHLPLRMLEGVHLLRSLTVSNCQLGDLPADLFSYTKSLRFLDLSENSLQFESSEGVFSSLNLLEELNLSSNWILIPALPEFAPLVSLRVLTIDNGFEEDISILNNSTAPRWPVLPSLERLSLNYNLIPRLWPDWHETMPKLKVLNLTGNSIATLTYQDLQLIRAGSWEVGLRENPLEAIWFEKTNYEAATQDHILVRNNATTPAILWIDSPQDCNCHWYWFMKLVRERPTYVSLPELQCRQQWGVSKDGIPFSEVSLKSLSCQLNETECVPGCACYRRAPDNMTLVNCTGAGLTHIPRINNMYELHFGNNHLNALHATDLPDTLTYMDLQYNRLTNVDKETVSSMFNGNSRSYRLTGNPIICECKNRVLVEALQRYSALVIDYENITCVDKRGVKDIDVNELCLKSPIPLTAGLIGTFALVFVIIIALYQRYKYKVNGILNSCGCTCCRNKEELDHKKIYDVFISFAHGDAPFAVDELVPAIEEAGIKVCVHYRDWIVGEWIPAQIARSVKQSHRTVIVLSRNFLASVWALLEFRTAHLQALKDGRSRLVVILLENTAAVIDDKRIDKELRSYLVTNTYIKWGDPRFWEKLLKVLLPHQETKQRIELDKGISGEEVIELIKVTDPPIKVRKDNEVLISSKYNSENELSITNDSVESFS